MAVRLFAIAALLGLLASAFCQDDPLLSKPQATVVVTKHTTGADMVEITMLDAKYPPDLVRSFALKVGEYTGSPSRGVALRYDNYGGGTNPNLNFLKATFATDFLIDRQKQILNIEPIIKAFCGAPKPNEIQAISIYFQGEKPGPQDIRRLKNENMLIVGSAEMRGPKQATAPPGVEYRVWLYTQDPSKITMPPPEEKSKESAKTQTNKGGNDVLLYVLIAVAAVSAGALVYFAMLNPGRKSASSNDSRRKH